MSQLEYCTVPFSLPLSGPLCKGTPKGAAASERGPFGAAAAVRITNSEQRTNQDKSPAAAADDAAAAEAEAATAFSTSSLIP